MYDVRLCRVTNINLPMQVTDGYFSNRSTDHFEGSPTGGQVGGQSTGKTSGATTKVATDDVSGDDYIPSDDSVDTENSPDLSDDDTKVRVAVTPFDSTYT